MSKPSDDILMRLVQSVLRRKHLVFIAVTLASCLLVACTDPAFVQRRDADGHLIATDNNPIAAPQGFAQNALAWGVLLSASAIVLAMQVKNYLTSKAQIKRRDKEEAAKKAATDAAAPPPTST